jgi:hypothetical protein
VYTGFFCLRRAASDAAVNTVVFLKLRGIYWLAEQLLPRIEDTGLLELAANGLVAPPQFRKKDVARKDVCNKTKRKTKMRWLDDVSTDLKKTGINEWRHRTRDREAWRRIVKDAKTHPGL